MHLEDGEEISSWSMTRRIVSVRLWRELYPIGPLLLSRPVLQEKTEVFPTPVYPG